ncbi:MAG: DUF423 domain-containing protein [Flavobacteriaceae bacterium]|jgi:uncharacterized membrane protein YgdD (TMEM256/DUF423 family)
MKNRNLIITAGTFAALGVVLGAFAAHVLEKQLTSDELSSFQTGVRYQIYHALALLILPVLPLNKTSLPARFFVGGTVLFSVSIYLLTLDRLMGVDLSFLGWVTPIGGLALITAWLLLIKIAYKA